MAKIIDLDIQLPLLSLPPVIESIEVNGVEQPIVDKTVDITVPTSPEISNIVITPYSFTASASFDVDSDSENTVNKLITLDTYGDVKDIEYIMGRGHLQTEIKNLSGSSTYNSRIVSLSQGMTVAVSETYQFNTLEVPYEFYEFIGNNDSNSFINTLVKIEPNDKIEFVWLHSANSAVGIFGDEQYSMRTMSQSGVYNYWGGSQVSGAILLSRIFNAYHTFYMDKNIITIDGITQYTYSGGNVTGTGISLFKCNSTQPYSTVSRGKLQYFKVTGSDGTLKHNLVPAKNFVTNAYGVADRVTGDFWAGTGSFTVGQPID